MRYQIPAEGVAYQYHNRIKPDCSDDLIYINMCCLRDHIVSPRDNNMISHAGSEAQSVQLLISWDLVVHPVTQVIGEQALVDILDLSEVAWTCWGVSTPAVGWG